MSVDDGLIAEISRLRRDGFTFKAIGDMLDQSEERVRGLFRRHGNKTDMPRVVSDGPGFGVEGEAAEESPVLPDLGELSRQERARAEQAHKDRMFKELLGQKSQTDAVIEAILDSIPRIPRHEVKRHSPPEVRNGKPQVGLLLLSDLHVGAVADREETGGFGEYNYATFQTRLRSLRDSIRSITLRERHFSPVDHLVVASLGDVIENDEIFPAQAGMIDLDLTEQVLCAVEEIAGFLVSLLDTYETIFVPSVTGNHGRIGRKGQRKRHINWDYLIGHMLAAKLERYADRITIEVPKAPFMLVDILGYKFLLRHGDGIKSWAGIPYYGIARSTGRWTAIQASQNERFHYMLMGHFHQPATLPYTGGETLINGCFPGVTEFSVEVMESLNRPTQVFGFVHPDYGLAARYQILLDRTPEFRVDEAA